MSVPAGSWPPGRTDSHGQRPCNAPDLLPRLDHPAWRSRQDTEPSWRHACRLASPCHVLLTYRIPDTGSAVEDLIARLAQIQAVHLGAPVRPGRKGSWEIWPATPGQTTSER